jgi:anti-sigma B factor antagonist
VSALERAAGAGTDEGEPPTAFMCSWTKEGRNAAWVRAAGALDRATVRELERRLDEAQQQARLVVLDLRRLVRIDQTGVHAVLASSARARQAGRRLILVRGSEQVDRVFILAGVSSELEVHDLRPPDPDAE